MGEQKANGITWCDYTWNLVWGCQRISPACESCYAEAFARRLGKHLWGPSATRQTMSASYWDQPVKWNRRAEKEGVRRKVFCSSMADVFEDHPTVEQERSKLWPLIKATPWLDWLLLTKRASRIAECLPEDWGEGYPNVWLGVTCENQEWADKRIPYLLDVPAVIRFLSCEPLLGPLDLSEYLQNEYYVAQADLQHRFDDGSRFETVIHQVIVGGESSFKARPMDTDWARAILMDCRHANTAFFMKQMSQAGWPDYKNYDSFPRDLQVREFPR